MKAAKTGRRVLLAARVRPASRASARVRLFSAAADGDAAPLGCGAEGPRQRLVAWGWAAELAGPDPLDPRRKPLPPTEICFRKLLRASRHPVDDEDVVEIRHLASSWGHGLVGFRKTKRNEPADLGCDSIFSFGANKSGQLGLGYASPGCRSGIVKMPALLNGETHPALLSVACGREHSLALCELGAGITAIYAFGNTMYGQLGVGRSKHDLDGSTTRRGFEQYRSSTSPVRETQPVPVAGGSVGDAIEITAGLDHSAVLRRDGTVWTMGWGADGQLGQGDTSARSSAAQGDGCDGDIPGRVAGLESVKIEKIVSGCADFTVAMEEKTNRMFTWGNSEYGQCMGGYKQDQVMRAQEVPIGVGRPEYGGGRIVDVAVGGTFAVLLDERGDVYTVGFGSIGLGDGVTETMTPRRVDFDIGPGQTVTGVFAGLEWAGAVIDNKYVHTWGHCPASPKMLTRPRPLDVVPELGKGRSFTIEKVAAGAHHALCVIKEAR